MTTLSPTDPPREAALTEGWLDAVFAAAREARIRTMPGATRRKMVVFAGSDLPQLRCLLRLRRAAPLDLDLDVGAFAWSIELRNTDHRVARLLVGFERFVSADGAGVAALRDPETLARWLDARGFHAPFSAWKASRGSVRSQSVRG